MENEALRKKISTLTKMGLKLTKFADVCGIKYQRLYFFAKGATNGGKLSNEEVSRIENKIAQLKAAL